MLILVATILVNNSSGSNVIATHIYTQTKVKQQHIFFWDTVLEVAERNMWVMEIKYFEIVNFITFMST